MATKLVSYNNNNFNIPYKIINNAASKNMLFLHGWGSNKALMEMAFGKHFKLFNHIYIDLPGFGDSYNDIFIDSFGYAGVIESFLQQIHINNISGCDIIVGHSFGGKISLLLNKEIILLSSSGILLKKSIKTKAKILMAKLIKHIGISNIAKKWLIAEDAKGLNPTMYDIFKHVVNEDFLDKYANFTHKATIFWGDNDKATPIESFHKIQTLMPKARSHIMQGDHYFFLKQGSIIEKLYYQDGH